MKQYEKIKKAILQLENNLTLFKNVSFKEIKDIVDISLDVDKSSSKSWLGYHSLVYYNNFQKPPPGAHFSSEWGIRKKHYGEGTTGEWQEYQYDDVINFIKKKSGNPNIDSIKHKSTQAEIHFEETKASALSIISASFPLKKDEHLNEIIENIKSIKVSKKKHFIDSLDKVKRCTYRDERAVSGGWLTPPHFDIWSERMAIMAPFESCNDLSKVLSRLAEHIRNLKDGLNRLSEMGERIFIGHGQSSCWMELKEFLTERLTLPVEEFNRESSAGIPIIERISEMLDQSCFAFLVMTSEDKQIDETFNPRMNVVHEAGLFQGRLGFKRAIILLEDSCQEFSNINGLGQIRFQKENMKSKFEEIRKTLEREGII